MSQRGVITSDHAGNELRVVEQTQARSHSYDNQYVIATKPADEQDDEDEGQAITLDQQQAQQVRDALLFLLPKENSLTAVVMQP